MSLADLDPISAGGTCRWAHFSGDVLSGIRSGGHKFAGSGKRPEGIGLIWMSVTRPLAVRVLLAVYFLSGLIAAALIVVRKSRVPLALYMWLALVLVIVPLALPEAIVVPWSGLPAPKALSVIDAGITLAIGGCAGLILGALTLPLVCRSHNQAQPGDSMEGLAWMGTMACLGLLVGWQAIPTAMAWILLVTLLARAVLKQMTPWSDVFRAQQPIVWAWLGFMIFRATWKSVHAWLHGLEQLPAWSADMLPLLIVFPMAWLASPQKSAAEEILSENSESDLT